MNKHYKGQTFQRAFELLLFSVILDNKTCDPIHLLILIQTLKDIKR